MEIDIKDALRNKYATIAVKRSNKSSDDEAALAMRSAIRTGS